MSRIGMVVTGIGFFRFPVGVLAREKMMSAFEGLPIVVGPENYVAAETKAGLLVVGTSDRFMWVTEFIRMGEKLSVDAKAEFSAIIDAMVRSSDVNGEGGAMYRSIGVEYLKKGTIDAMLESGVIRCYLKEQMGLLPRYGSEMTHPQFALDQVRRGYWQDVTAIEDAEHLDDVLLG